MLKRPRLWVGIFSTLSLALCLAPSASAQCEFTKLTAQDGIAGARAGRAVALLGDRAFVGAPLDADGGCVHVYLRSGEIWTLEAELRAADTWPGDEFGCDISASLDFVAIGARKNGATGNHAGAVYVFRRQGTNWVEEAKLTAPADTPSHQLGHAVATHGNKILVGSRLDDAAGRNSGAAHLFRYENSNWLHKHMFRASNGRAYDRFGHALAIFENHVLIGADLCDLAGEDSGAAYLYERIDGKWSEEIILAPADLRDRDRFGFSVALHGDLALVGAHLQGSGVVYTYRRSNGRWKEGDKLMAADLVHGDQFGYSLSVRGARAAIGSVAEDDYGLKAGSVYVYDFDGNQWIESVRLNSASLEDDDEFGRTVAINDTLVLVGAPNDDDAEDEAGAAYAFYMSHYIADWMNYGEGWAGTLGIPTLLPANPPILGDTLYVEMSNSAGLATRAGLFVGADEDEIDTVMGGTLYLDPLYLIPFSFDSADDIVLPFEVPCLAGLDGLSLYVQGITLDYGASHTISFTEALRLEIGHN